MEDVISQINGDKIGRTQHPLPNDCDPVCLQKSLWYDHVYYSYKQKGILINPFYI